MTVTFLYDHRNGNRYYRSRSHPEGGGALGDSFLKYVFTPAEIEHAQKFKFPYRHYAGRFAASYFKAMGIPNLSWQDVASLSMTAPPVNPFVFLEMMNLNTGFWFRFLQQGLCRCQRHCWEVILTRQRGISGICWSLPDHHQCSEQAALVALMAAMRSGAGLVTAAVPKSSNLTLQKNLQLCDDKNAFEQRGLRGLFLLKLLVSLRKSGKNFDVVSYRSRFPGAWSVWRTKVCLSGY